jgi:hypothetical protein
MRSTYLNQNFVPPGVGEGPIGEVLDEIDKDQHAAGPVIHRDLA